VRREARSGQWHAAMARQAAFEWRALFSPTAQRQSSTFACVIDVGGV